MRFRVFAPRNLVIASALLVALMAAGTAWYAWVEDFSFVDALYQTVIIFTVGFSEVEPLDVSGRAFTVVLILLGIGIMFYVASAIVELAVDPTNVVYRREAGATPPMPPCGRRAL